MKKLIIASLLGILTLSSSSYATKAETTRTVNVEMGDNMRFAPASIDVKKGETIRFVVKNAGTLQHEMFVGTAEEIKKHSDMMRKMPTMPNTEKTQISLKGGQTGEFVFKSDKSGTLDFGCYQPGHSEAGMKGKINVK